MNITDKLELVDILRLRANKNITRSKMYIKDQNGGYTIWTNPKTDHPHKSPGGRSRMLHRD